MEELKGRLGYLDKKKQNEATRRYRETENGKEKTRRNVAKSQTKKFILEYATDEDIIVVKDWINERELKK